MIVPSMTVDQMIREMLLDIPSVERRAEYFAQGLRRQAVKSKDKQAKSFMLYNSPRHNKWLIRANHYVSYSIYNNSLFCLNPHGMNYLFRQQKSDMIIYITAHFLKRYNERFLNTTFDSLEVYKRYLNGNHRMVLNLEEFKPVDDLMIKLGEGIAFASLRKFNGDFIFCSFKTFISNEMILDFQRATDFKLTLTYESFSEYMKHLKPKQLK